MSRFRIRKVAVLGAGVMGAQIAAHLANARVPVILFDLAAQDGSDNNAIANKAIVGLSKQKPAHKKLSFTLLKSLAVVTFSPQ